MALLSAPTFLRAQTWTWTTETVDKAGKFTWLAVDQDGNVHISYVGEDGVRYGFRPVGQSKWFTMPLGYSAAFTRIAVDSHGNPHMCFTNGKIYYADWNGKTWNAQVIAPGTGRHEFSCGIAVASDGTPHVTWYQEVNADMTYFTHFRYAVLRDGAWLAQTIDFEGQTGKWTNMVVDAQGNPYISYDSFIAGKAKYAHYDGKHWIVNTIDERGKRASGAYNIGMGNSIVLGADGRPQVAFEDQYSLNYARLEGNRWVTEHVDTISPSMSWLDYRTSIALDENGNPHIAYEDAGTLKHAYWDGKEWHVQLLVGSGAERWRYCAIASDHRGHLYISYRDPVDGSLKVSTGELKNSPAPAKSVQRAASTTSSN